MLIELGKLIFEILASVKAMALTSKVMEARISFNCWKLNPLHFTSSHLDNLILVKLNPF